MKTTYEIQKAHLEELEDIYGKQVFDLNMKYKNVVDSLTIFLDLADMYDSVIYDIVTDTLIKAYYIKRDSIEDKQASALKNFR